jgi:hypothetical protein
MALSIIRYILTLPAFMGWLFPVLSLLGLAKEPHFLGDGVLAAIWRPWVLKPRAVLQKIKWPFGRMFDEQGIATYDPTLSVARNWWKYSVTLSRGMVLQPDVSTQLLQHEKIHVRQVEDRLLLALSLGVTASLAESDPWWLLLWVSGVTWQLPNFLGAVLRRGHIYRDTEHERSAYAQTDMHHVKDKNWLDVHLSSDRTL